MLNVIIKIRLSIIVLLSVTLFRQLGASQDTPTQKNDIEIKVLPGFQVKKVYSVPAETHGSWVGLTSDDKGRLIACAQYGQGIFRITPSMPTPKVEKLTINLRVGGARGILYAFDSLYVFYNQKGLYRLTDTTGDDQFDKSEFLIPFDGKPEHGIHSIVRGPDKKSLYLICGNMTTLPDSVKKSRASRKWGEDHLLPQMDDPNGHNKGRLAPGGFILKVSPDGVEQELIAYGFRNQFDVAFNQHGELFTWDADMEWDLGTPWYRPTRVNHITSGADFGWRSGSGKWPSYYPDNLPSNLDIGPGSPTGLCNGMGAKFPEKYQKAIFMNDWTYGTMYALHLEFEGSTYKVTSEEFLSGKPLPLTDVVIHTDGNLYFLVGGRGTTSTLYQVSYIGDLPKDPVKTKIAQIPEMVQIRRNLEKLHLDGTTVDAVDEAWSYLNHQDRFIRYAARVAIEKQPPASWQDYFSAETSDWAVIEGAVALARIGEKKHQPKILEKLNQLDKRKLPRGQVLATMRAYQLAFTRMGKPSDDLAKRVTDHLNPLFPSKDPFFNRELAQILLYLEAPGIVSKAIDQMLNAKPVEQQDYAKTLLERNDTYKRAFNRIKNSQPNAQQIAFAFALRSIKKGWTKDDYLNYFLWFPSAKLWQGGNSFPKYIENIRKEALNNIEDPFMRKIWGLISGKTLKKEREIFPPKGPARIWTVASATATVENNLVNRNFHSGENLYHATACASCHRFAGTGSGGIGPDLTGSANRYSVRDMMENIIEPSRVISDQYGSTVLTMKDGTTKTGRLGATEGDLITLMPNPFSSEAIMIKKDHILEQKESTVSSMPAGLIYPLNENELSDLIAYIFSAGNPKHEFFTK